MANLAKNENMFDRLFDFRRNFDDLFSDIVAGRAQGRGVMVAVPPIEIWVDPNEKKYHVSMALAGVRPEEVQLNLQGNTLTVSGEHKEDNTREDANYLQREFSYGEFERLIELPEVVDTKALTAQYNNGLLEITAPLKADALPKQIQIQNVQPEGSSQQGTAQSASAKAAATST